MEIAEFLLARIAEDEAVARAATSGPWSIDEHPDRDYPDGTMWAVEGPIPDGDKWPAKVVDVSSDRDYGNPEGGCDRREDADHIARHDPARVLAECEAKRRIVGLGICTACAVEYQPCNHQDETLRILALPYADHPDYRAEWKP